MSNLIDVLRTNLLDFNVFHALTQVFRKSVATYDSQEAACKTKSAKPVKRLLQRFCADSQICNCNFRAVQMRFLANVPKHMYTDNLFAIWLTTVDVVTNLCVLNKLFRSTFLLLLW